MFDFDKLEQREQRDSAIPVEVSSVEVEEGFGIYAVSDVHTDKRENMDLLRTWPARPRDVLLLAGDVSNDLSVVRTTLELLLERFGHVFFCPGNHDLWLHPKDGCKDSVEKFWKLEGLCQELGVKTQPSYVGKVLIVPLLSWYHSSFDKEPDIQDDTLVPVEKMMSDFMLCKWPPGLTPLAGSDSIATFFDQLNDQRTAAVNQERPAAVISFSHFLPRAELLPEKRFLYFPPIAKAVGSLLLGERVKRLSPDLHVFGHTHYGWSTSLDGTRFLQACLAYPRERSDRPFSVFCKRDGLKQCPPLLVYGHPTGEFPSYDGFWSGYYQEQPKRHDLPWLYQRRDQAPIPPRGLRRGLRKHGPEVEGPERPEGLTIPYR
ncbi:unnamed protein product [Durusdinium trenchii]|uniref:Calcineurin-like phosphoesterase domain-containing protein n=1 Tax=Durusdinium trenchii TaxID=1381693 RepID=A0ABP0K6Y9_9DINO